MISMGLILLINNDGVPMFYFVTHPAKTMQVLTLPYSRIWNQNVRQTVPFFIRNQYSAIAHKRSNTTSIIVRVKVSKYMFSESLLNALPIQV